MPARKDVDGSESVPAFYGSELRWKREEAGLTLKDVVKDCYYSVSYLSEIERGQRRMPMDLAAHVDRVLGTDGFFKRRCEDVRKARQVGHADYFARALEAETHAESIEEWSPSILPGLLQTPAYARATVLAAHPDSSDEEVKEKVDARMARAKLFADDHKVPSYWAVLHEQLLRFPVLSPEEMAGQLEHIAALARSRRIVPQVLPWNSGAHPLMEGTITLMTFPDAPPLVYVESSYSGQNIDDPLLVKRYRKAYDRLRAVALSPAASLSMIEAMAEDSRNGKQAN
ncbi:helix-turn-helix domain-containing protein [Streptomyces benahoarensis]|uniref:Helix-turn-helix domain-containing protein n=1 Tax=Streptomyces benahoarensis TaxID=2595054 RepID=A0A553Z0Z3_9ACTN|nr:helix-turn-helix transcriptional regulator [Streptomyces benahoarensis]TSB17730.1 helix-turn-helix domain-containing protein [Streptomyces benahoarensis]TSB35146.1 helix-turn-helix domain-containing protein [Streptomyces benahoarensis]